MLSKPKNALIRFKKYILIIWNEVFIVKKRTGSRSKIK